MDYVNSKATFKCDQLQGAISVLEVKNDKADFSSAKVLTQDVLLSFSGICKKLTQMNNNIPTPCPFMAPTPFSWSGVSTNVTACGSKILLKSSHASCPNPVAGGKITIAVSGVSSRYVEGGVGAIPEIKLVGREKGDLAHTAGSASSTATTATTVNPKSEKGEAGDKKAAQSAKQDTKKEQADALCPGCAKQDTCEYCKASTEVNNNSGVLRKNYNAKAQRDKRDEYFWDKYSDPECSKYTYAAHHVISGNQVFKQYPEIVKMANFSGYDINNALNCIMLVSKQDEYGKCTDFMKGVSGFDAMSVVGLQWHLGGHSYSFDLDTLVQLRQGIKRHKHTEVVGSIKNYAQLLREELAKMADSMAAHKTCRNTPQQKAAFIRRMNNLSARVRERLASFSDRRTDSYPYYVSETAYRYAFAVPDTVKVCIVRKETDGYSLAKYRLKRLRDRGEYVPTPITNGAGSSPTHFTAQDAREAIEFCENIEHFIFVGYAKAGILPFTPECTFAVYGNPDDKTIFGERDSQLLKWLEENPREYVAKVRKIKERLGGAK